MIPIGDAICQFNPIYGQGMSAAVQQSRLLQTALASAAHESDPLSAAQVAFAFGIESILQTPWTMALNSDLAFPQTQATRPDNFEHPSELRRRCSGVIGLKRIRFRQAEVLLDVQVLIGVGSRGRSAS
ncbi:hypothetical protein [Bradyrhizobium sp. F1.13.3]|uniref:hypothetical protein n=1 Tax=Bradyrhizobium sp. F1.13.3 TaxID=3156351 RepID=UPI00339A901A